jgi:biopolymer transport protein ExbB/TolQ
MPATHIILIWILLALIVVLFIRIRGCAHKTEEQDDQIKTLSSMLRASLPGGTVNYLEAEIKRAGEEIDEAKKRNELAHEAFFEGYRSALRNVLAAIRGWL